MAQRKYLALGIFLFSLGLLAAFDVVKPVAGSTAAAAATLTPVSASEQRVFLLDPGAAPPACAQVADEGAKPTEPITSCIDLLFVADDGDYRQDTDGDTFVEDVKNLVSNAFEPAPECQRDDETTEPEDCRKLETMRSYFRFWYTTDLGHIETETPFLGKETCIDPRLPQGWAQDGSTRATLENAPQLGASLDAAAIIHHRSINDATAPPVMTSEWRQPRTFLHELAHAALGMADEYYPGGGYMLPLHPEVEDPTLPAPTPPPTNIFESETTCQDFARARGFAITECAKLHGWQWGVFLVFDDSHYRFDQEKATPKPTEAPLMFKAQGALMPFDDLFFRASGARLAYVYEQCGVGQCGTVNVYGEKAQFRQEGETPARSLVISGELKKTSGNETVPCSPPPKEGTPTPTPTPEVPLIYQLDATTLRVEVVDAPPKSQLLSNMGSLAFRLNYRPGTSLLDRLNLVTLLNPGVVLVECDEEDDPSDKSVPLRGGLYFLPKARFGLVLPFNPLLANFTIQPIEAKDLGPVVYDPIEAVRNDLVDRAIVAHFDQSVFDPYRYPTVLKDDDLRVIAQRDDLRSKFTHVTLPKWFEVGRVGEQPGNLDVGRAVLDKETADNTFLITNQVLETLTATGANSKVEPQLASVTPADPTHLSWHVRLAQENVRFHDGTSLDAEALRFNFDRWQEAGLLDIAKVELVADNELVVTLNQADRGFAARLAQPQFGVHSPMAVQRYRSAYGSPEVGVVGTGPFRFKSRDPASRSAQIVLERNENYRGNAPQMKLVTVSYVPAGSNPINLVGRNQVDFLAMPPGSVTSEEVGALNLDLKEETTFRTVYLGLDLSLNPDNPLVDPRVREALGLGLDRADMAALLAQELDATTSVVPARPGEAPAVARFDYTAARKLLRDAGYEAGFTLDLFYSDAETDRYPGLLNALDKIALDLGNLGVQVRLRRTPEGIYETRRRDGTLRSLLEPTPPVGVAHFMPGFVLTLRPTAEPTPPPQPPAAVSYVGVLEDSLGQMRDADVLLEAPGAARTLFTRARFLATMPVSVAELGPLYGKFVAQEAEKNHLVLPLAVEARSVAVLAHSSVSGLKFTGDTAVLSLKDVTVNR